MEIIIKITLIGVLLLIFWQDVKDREVYWFLFPLMAVCAGILHFLNISPITAMLNITINMIIVAVLLLSVFLYSNYRLKLHFFEAIGLGDVLLFLGLSMTFSTISFVIILVFGLLFSLITFLSVKKRAKFKVVPLAGYLSLFFCLTYLADWLDIIHNLYWI